MNATLFKIATTANGGVKVVVAYAVKRVLGVARAAKKLIVPRPHQSSRRPRYL
jgi:hypothetical protein